MSSVGQWFDPDDGVKLEAGEVIVSRQFGNVDTYHTGICISVRQMRSAFVIDLEALDDVNGCMNCSGDAYQVGRADADLAFYRRVAADGGGRT